jgi:hypothetical protein
MLAEIGFLVADALAGRLLAGAEMRDGAGGAVGRISRSQSVDLVSTGCGMKAVVVGGASVWTGAGSRASNMVIAISGCVESALEVSASGNLRGVTVGAAGAVSIGGVCFRKLAGTGLTGLLRGLEEITSGECLTVSIGRAGCDSVVPCAPGWTGLAAVDRDGGAT